MIIKVGGGLEPLGPIGVYAYARTTSYCHAGVTAVCFIGVVPCVSPPSRPSGSFAYFVVCELNVALSLFPCFVGM